MKNKICFRPKIRQKTTKILAATDLNTINDEMERDASFKRLVFEKKEGMNSCSTRCSKRVNKLTLFDNSRMDGNEEGRRALSPEVKVRPFNTGYILN